MKIKVILLSVLLTSFAHANSWDGTNNPYNMNTNYNYQFSQLPLSGTVDEKHMPWSDNYWESDWGGISFRWNTTTVENRDPDSGIKVNQWDYFKYTPPTEAEVKRMSRSELINLSPAEKYDIFMRRFDYPTVRSERERTGPGIEDWQGICHGWVPASINHPEPLPVDMNNGAGVIVPFGSTDVKGLLSYYYGVPAYDFARGTRTIARFGDMLKMLVSPDTYDMTTWAPVPADYSANSLGNYADVSTCTNLECFRGNTAEVSIDSLDVVGQIGARPEKHRGVFRSGTSGVQDPNAGAFHVVMANQLGLMNHAFVGNINKKIKNAQIWNQPIVGYSSHITSDRGGRHGRVVGITTRLVYVSEIPQTFEPVVGTPNQRFSEMIFSYTVEIDGSGNITGGQWDDSAYHPSFAWKHDAIEIKGYFGKLNQIYKPRF